MYTRTLILSHDNSAPGLFSCTFAIAGYQYAGLEYLYECFCGDYDYDIYGEVADYQCNETCPGNPNQTCGGPWRLSVYHTGEKVVVLQLCGSFV